MGFFQNTCKPKGFSGKIMVHMMNMGHAKFSKWCFTHISLKENAEILDIGCGGGANISIWLEKCPKGKVTGIDYSEVSVEQSIKKNYQAVQEKRCNIVLGDVSQMPFSDESFDFISAFETIYFWKDLEKCFKEVLRVLKPEGRFMVAVELDGTKPSDEKWMKSIKGLNAYTAEEIKNFLANAGFKSIQINKSNEGALCIISSK